MRHRKRTAIRRHPHVRPMFAGLRRYDRKAAQIDVVVIDEGGHEIPFETVNISESGVFVSSSLLYEVGQIHTLILRERGGQEIRLRGKIVRVEGRKARGGVVPGMAYQFMQTDRDTWHELAGLVAAL